MAYHPPKDVVLCETTMVALTKKMNEYLSDGWIAKHPPTKIGPGEYTAVVHKEGYTTMPFYMSGW
jgi:hypothetical protein